MGQVSLPSLGAFAPREAQETFDNVKFGVLRNCANLFYFGLRDVYQIRQENGNLIAKTVGKKFPSLTLVLAKVVAIATVIIPILAIVGALIYSFSNKITILSMQKFKDDFARAVADEDWNALGKLADDVRIRNLSLNDMGSFYKVCQKCAQNYQMDVFKKLIDAPLFAKIKIQ